MKRIIAVIFACCLAMPFAMTAGAVEIEISGAIEVETGMVEEDSVKGEDITTATVELAFDAQVADQVEAHVLLLHEEDEPESIVVDEAFIVLNPTEQFFVQAGTYVVPFGSYEALVLSDPLTLDIGETGQTAITLGFSTGPVTIQAGTFNGDVMEASETEEKINVYFAAVDYSTDEDAEMPISAGLSYISSIADSDGLEGALATPGTVDSSVAGYAAHASVGFGMVTVIAEYVSAASEFKANDFDGITEEIKPQAYNLEVGLDVNDKTSVAFRYGGSKDTPELFETVMAAAVSYELYESTTIAAEYLTGSFEDDSVDDTTALTFQLAVGF